MHQNAQIAEIGSAGFFYERISLKYTTNNEKNQVW